MEIHCLAFACLTAYTYCTPLRNAWRLLYWNQLLRYSCVNTREYKNGTWFSQRITTFVPTWKYISDTEIFIRSNVPTSKLRCWQTCDNIYVPAVRKVRNWLIHRPAADRESVTKHCPEHWWKTLSCPLECSRTQPWKLSSETWRRRLQAATCQARP